MERVVRRGVAGLAPPPREGSPDAPLRLFAVETLDEYATAVAAAVGLGPGARWAPFLRPATSRLPDVLAPDELDLGRLAAEERRYLRLPGGFSPERPSEPMRWFLASLLAGAEDDVRLDEHVERLLRELAELPPCVRLERVADLAGVDATETAVIAFGDALWALPAMLDAASTRRAFLWVGSEDELLEVARGGFDSLTVCLPFADFTSDTVDRVVRGVSFGTSLPRMRHVAFQRTGLSFLTARTLEILTRVVALQATSEQSRVGRVGWVLTEDGQRPLLDPDVVTVGADEATAAAVVELGELDLLMLWGHSREDLFHLAGDALCGASSEAFSADPRGRLPACMHDGRCVKEGRIVRIADIPARALVVGGCNIVRLGDRGTFAPEFALALSALEGRTSVVVASPRTRSGSPVEHVFLYRLLRAGTALDDAVRVMNNALPLWGLEIPDTLVLGAGHRPLFPADQKAGPAAVTRHAAGWTIEFRDVDAHYAEFRLPTAASTIWVRLAEATPAPAALDELYSAAAPEPDGSLRVFVFGRGRLVADRLEIVVDEREPAGHERAALASVYRNFDAYGRLLRSYVPKLGNQHDELRSLGRYIARQVKDARYRLDACAKAEAKAAESRALRLRMDESLCRDFLERVAVRAFVWHDQYLDVDGTFGIDRYGASGQRCPYCEGVIVVKHVKHVYVHAVRRELAICETCGTISDIPRRGIRPLFRGPEVLERARSHAYAVVVRNVLPRPVDGQLGFRVRRAGRFGTGVDPPLVAVSLESGEEKVLPFELTIGEEMPAHMEVIRGFWVSELSVSVFQRNVWIVPETSAGDGAQAEA
jgi:hypothetical protein